MGKKKAASTNSSATEGDAAEGLIVEPRASGEAPEPGEAHAAYESRKAAWKLRGGVELGPPRVNLAYVSARVIQIGTALSEPATLAAYDALTKVPLPDGAKFDAAPVKLLPTVARAIWYARTQYLTADAQSSTVALPPALVAEATKLRAKKFKVVEYNCVDDDDPEDPVAADLESIKEVQGPRFLDLATDLSRLAAYYRNPTWIPVLEADTRRFNPKDALRAEKLAADILAALHQRSDASSTWLVELYRGWSELQEFYDVARRGGSFVFWGELDARIPALGSMRAPSSRKSASEKKPVDPEKKPADAEKKPA